jgi:glycosyltransferase involved in cell wall biosynthesis
VSALIPTYNRRTLVFRAIDSVLAQTVPVDEIIVVDDGSTDGTVEAIRSRYGSCIKVLRQEENTGEGGARRRAIEEAQGEWVAFLDSASAVPETVAWIFGDTEFITDKGGGGTIFGENGLVIDHGPHLFKHPLSEIVLDPGRPRACLLHSSFIRRSALIELKCFTEGLRVCPDYLAQMQAASRFAFAAIPAVVTRLYRTSDLRESSLEHNMRSSADHYRAIMLGSAVAAQTTGAKSWGRLHADSVRAFCKWRAQKGLPIRRLAVEQFRFGVSTRSVVFFGAAMLGAAFFRAGFAVKRKLRVIRQAK